MDRQNTVERAFILAKSGSCLTVTDIRQQLKKEQMDAVDAHLAGPAIQRQLRLHISRSAVDQAA